jgi:hypothetical protein
MALKTTATESWYPFRSFFKRTAELLSTGQNRRRRVTIWRPSGLCCNASRQSIRARTGRGVGEVELVGAAAGRGEALAEPDRRTRRLAGVNLRLASSGWRAIFRGSDVRRAGRDERRAIGLREAHDHPAVLRRQHLLAHRLQGLVRAWTGTHGGLVADGDGLGEGRLARVLATQELTRQVILPRPWLVGGGFGNCFFVGIAELRPASNTELAR